MNNHLQQGPVSQTLILIASIAAIILLFLIINLIRKRKLSVGYSLVWLLISVSTLFMAFSPNSLFFISDILGISYAPAALFLIIFTFSMLMLLHLTLVISKQKKQITVLIHEIGLLKHKLTKINKE